MVVKQRFPVIGNLCEGKISFARAGFHELVVIDISIARAFASYACAYAKVNTKSGGRDGYTAVSEECQRMCENR